MPELKFIQNGDYQSAYLSLFRRLVEDADGYEILPPPSSLDLPALDEGVLLAQAHGNPWQMARLLGAWIACQQGHTQLGRVISQGGREYRLFPVNHPAGNWPAGNPRHWFHPLWPVPRYLPVQDAQMVEVDFVHLPDNIDHDLSSATIRVFAAEFCDRVELELHTVSDSFHCAGLKDANTRWQSIETALNQAKDWEAHIVLMPELSVTPELRQQIVGWLRQNREVFRLVIAGSFHQENSQGKIVNRCVLLRGNGLQLAEFNKWLAYTNRALGVENITPGERLLVVETPIGLWTPTICLDFLQREENKRKNHPEFPWNRIGGDLLLVASMGHESTVAGHKARAATLFAEFYPRIVVANMTPESDGSHPGFSLYKGESRDNTPPHSLSPSKSLRPRFKVVK